MKIIKEIMCKIRLLKAKLNGACFEGSNKIGFGTRVDRSYLGFATYIAENTYLNNVIIGKYCSIASNVRVVRGFHPSSCWVSTHPAFFSINGQSGVVYTKKNRFDEERFIDSDKKYVIKIGNDVWIGYGVIIFSGVRIGDGAIIAAGAVVKEDVPPYSIVGGVPAKVLKYRFNLDEIEFLMKLKWWDNNDEWIRKYSNKFSNIIEFRKAIEEEGNLFDERKKNN